jgi:UDP:flavonoid glycosyltransferase YjiC (YdhE family)
VRRALVVTLPEKGHYHPLLGPALELARRGADVTLAATADIRSELAAAVDGRLRVVVPPGAAPPATHIRGEALARVLVDPAALAGWIRELLVEAPRLGIEPLRAIIRDLRPDVVAIDSMAYAAAIAAELERVPWVGWATSLNPVVPDAPANPTEVGRAARPEGVRSTVASPTAVGRAARPEGVRSMVASPTEVGRAAPPEGVRRMVASPTEVGRAAPPEAVRSLIDSQLIRTLRVLDSERRALFADHGLAARFRVSDVLSPRGTAAFATEAFVGPAPPGVALVGPSLGGTRGGERIDPAFAGGRPIAYVSFGSQAWHQPRRFARIFEAADALGLAVIAAMGDLAASPSPGHACVRFAAQLEALAVARVAITHGGANSVMESLALGVPMLVAPICNDQPHSRWFVERAGCGLGIDLEACTQADLVAALARLANEGPERGRAAEIAASYRRDGAVGAADLAERAC